MARKPVYGFHKTSAQARTTVNEKRISLGKYGSRESKVIFDDILAQREADHAQRTKTSTGLTIGRLAVLFMEHADREYQHDRKQTGEANGFRHALKAPVAAFHRVRVVDIGPKKLNSVQSRMVDQGLSQSTISSRIRRIRQVSSWGVSEELVSVSVIETLKTVQGLRAGRTTAQPPIARTGDTTG